MTKEEIIKMAKQAGFDPHDMSSDFTCNLKDIEAFAKLVAEKEREACSECGADGGHALYCVACAEKHVKRKWVGLTDKEQMAIAYSDINCWDWGLLLDATEAKLKEKNT
jgi:hypothetical protein